MDANTAFYFYITVVSIQVSPQNYKRGTEGVSYARFVKNPSARLNSFVFNTVKVSEIDECSLHCISNPDCFSVNFGKSSDGMHLCELINTDRFNQPGNFVPDEGFDHYNIKTPCMLNLCQFESLCQPIYSLDDYHCVCTPGYTGHYCETDIDECASSPCIHGTCSNLLNRYTCTCLPGYTAINCDLDINECASSPCVHGACNNLLNRFTCTCEAGYTGINCDLDINECASSPCVHGTCNNLLNRFACTCEDGYTGINCDSDINECASSPCVHGTCNNLLNRFACTCEDGYTGINCDLDINECASSPCLHGTCNNLANRYTCTCEYGYVGFNCDSALKGYVLSYPATSCKDVLSTTPGTPNGAYYITTENWGNVKTYCHMDHITGCGGGGWTMAMKIDGTQNTFGFHSALWSNKNGHNHINGGQTGFNSLETKLPSYWSTPFDKICLGMTVSGVTRWMSLLYPAGSLYALIADGQYRGTSLGVAAWKNLVGSGSLQYNCRYEGFNPTLGSDEGVRIGILGNNELWCSEGDSWLGFGGLKAMSCGNKAEWYADNGDKHTPAFCYVLVQ